MEIDTGVTGVLLHGATCRTPCSLRCRARCIHLDKELKWITQDERDGYFHRWHGVRGELLIAAEQPELGGAPPLAQ